MFSFVSVFAHIGSRKQPFDDDSVDRLNHRYTVVMLVAFALVINTVQYVGNPINCWVPQHFTGSHAKYTNTFCWVKNTYYLPFHEDIMSEDEYNSEQPEEIVYYQWLPFILLAQAVLFYFPSIVWRGLNSKAGVDSDDIMHATYKFDRACSMGERKKQMELIVNQLHRFVGNPRRSPRGVVASPEDKKKVTIKGRMPCGKKLGNYLVCLYLVVKVLYIINLIGQLFFLNFALGLDFSNFGIDMIENFSKDTFATVHSNTSAFPRVTMCNFKARRLGNVHRYTVQCVLPINLYAEKIYFFLWFWLMFVLGLTALSLIFWILQSLVYEDKKRYIRNHLKYGQRLETTFDRQLANDFVDDYLRPDGVFVLRLISHNTNGLTSSEIICSLWDHWRYPPLKDTIAPTLPEPDAFGLTEPPVYPSAPTKTPEPFVDPDNDIAPLLDDGSKPPRNQKPPTMPKPARFKSP